MATEKSADKAHTLIWDALCETNPEFTKEFDKGTYKGTSINPVYQFKKLTETFGPCGFGWKYEIANSEHLHMQDGTIMIFHDVKLFVKQNGVWSEPVMGTGGDFVARLSKDGKVRCDDDGRKKALTDALTNAATKLGMSADIHMGYFDDEEYKVDLAAKFSHEPWADRSAKIFVWDLTGIIGQCMTEKAIDELLDREREQYTLLADFLKETVESVANSRKAQIKNGTTPPKLKSGKYFVDVQHALDWCAHSKKYIENATSPVMLEDWFGRNESLIDGLNVDLKAAKYLVGGKGRGTVLKEFYLSKLNQLQPQAAE